MSDTSPPWPGPDEDRMISEMLANLNSPYWNSCVAEVQKLVTTCTPGFDKYDRKDIVQGVMFAVYRNLPAFRREARLRTWLARLVIAGVGDFVRAENRQRRGADSLDANQEGDDTPSIQPLSPHDVEREAAWRDLLSRAMQAINKYIATRQNPELVSTIIILWLGEGKKPKEIADQLGIKPQDVSNVKFQLQRYLEVLRDEWRTDHFAPASHQSSSATGRDPNALDALERDKRDTGGAS